MKRVFAPGCALMLYKQHVAEKIHSFLNANLGEMDKLMTCCKHEPQLITKTEVINICPGCDKRFRNNYENTSTISLWEILAQNDFFHFPDYKGRIMSIMDACPVRDRKDVHESIRILLKRMNINLIEPKNTRTKSICCGDTSYGVIPTEKVIQQMKKRTSEIPAEDVVVYCVSCIKSVYIGGKRPHYMIDLLYNEETLPKTYEPDLWHKALDDYISKH